MEDPKPGQLIVPHDTEPVATPSPNAEPVAQGEVVAPLVVASQAANDLTPVADVPERPVPVQATDASVPEATPTSWQFSQEEIDPNIPDVQPPSEDIRWTAAEFIAHEKTSTWYLTLATVGLVAAALLYLLTKDKISTGITLFAVIAFAAFASRKPKSQDYAVTSQGVEVGTKSFGFQEFKNFSVIEEGAVVSIAFMPLKRFMPGLTIYVAPEAESKVVDFLSVFLPYQEHKPDAVDSLLRRIRF